MNGKEFVELMKELPEPDPEFVKDVQDGIAEANRPLSLPEYVAAEAGGPNDLDPAWENAGLQVWLNAEVVVVPGEDGKFVATVPAIPGCISQGETEAEARANVAEAIQLCYETAQADAAVQEVAGRILAAAHHKLPSA